MTLPRLDAVLEHWKVVPPIGQSLNAIANFLGVGRKGQARKVKAEPADPQALMDLLGGNGFATEKPAWLKAATT